MASMHAAWARATSSVQIGSGITPDNLSHYAAADAFIVGTAAKRDGTWENPPDPERARALVEAFEKLPAGPDPGDADT